MPLVEEDVPSVLALVPGTPPSVEGRTLSIPGLDVEVRRSLAPGQATPLADLVVLAGMTVDEQQRIASELHTERRWRLVPILYAIPAAVPGMPVPATFRPEIDGLVKGDLHSRQVEHKIRVLARDGVAGNAPVTAGVLELDPVRRKLRAGEAVVALTEREADLLAVLIARAGRTVSSTELIELGWGAPADARGLQNLRRHVSNLRRKLSRHVGPRALQTVRGAGYRLTTAEPRYRSRA